LDDFAPWPHNKFGVFMVKSAYNLTWRVTNPLLFSVAGLGVGCRQIQFLEKNIENKCGVLKPQAR
jgi:hypothetical protein